MSIETLKIGTRLLCVKDVFCEKPRRKIFDKEDVCEVQFVMNPILAEGYFGISNPKSATGSTVIDIDTIRENFSLIK